MRVRLLSGCAVVAALGTAVLTAVPPLADAATGHRARLTAPVVRESFTPLPCTGRPGNRSTTEQEGCLEQQILKTDQQIDALNREIFTRLGTASARRDFVAGHNAWFRYRRSYCLSVSDVFQGGTLAGVLDAQCMASVNSQHVRDLRAFAADLRGSG
jgi:uncharacterized protein YecT (DUF1311 family)